MKSPFQMAQQAFLAHDSQDFLMIDRPAISVKLGRDAPIPIPWKVQAQSLDGISERGVLFQGRSGRRKALLQIPASVDAEHLAQTAHRDLWMFGFGLRDQDVPLLRRPLSNAFLWLYWG